MKIFIYCQHVLGLGHYFRTLELCRALNRHEIVLVSGGPPVQAKLSPTIREVRLPQLMMDQDFSTLLAGDDASPVDTIKKKRRQMLFGLYKQEKPDVLLVVLYPFGRRAFAFEIDPLLKGIRKHILPPALVVCSLRDILVGRKKNYQASYESKVVNALNQLFDALLIHADPNLIRLDRTFGSLADINIPQIYTGYVAPAPPPNARRKMRARLALSEKDKLIVASLGGGRVGEKLLKAVVRAFTLLDRSAARRLIMFTGPFMDEKTFAQLQDDASEYIQINRFSPDFISYLAAADLSVSMGGYNTCMNILATRVPSLVWPFSQNHEQHIRAERLAEMGVLATLKLEDLEPWHLAARMEQMLSDFERSSHHLDLNGAANAAQWLQKRVAGEKKASIK